MKKLLALAMAVALSASVSYAGFLDNVKYYGEGSFYGLSSQGNGFYDAATLFYGTIGISADIYENISASFGVGYTDLWGSNSAYAYRGSAIAVDAYSYGILGNLRITEANVSFDKIFDIDGLKIKIGRQFYGDEDSAVMFFGVRKDNPSISQLETITSIEAVTAYYENEHIKANAVFSTFRNTSLSSHTNRNITLKGFDFKYLNIVNMFDAQAYFYDLENYNAYLSYSPRHYDILGLKGTFHKTIHENEIRASLEIATNYAGDKILDDDIKALSTSIIKMDASYNISKINLTPRASLGFYGGYDKKDGTKVFASFGNYYPGLILGGRGSGIGGKLISDVSIVNLGADYKYKKFIFSFDFFNFSHDNDNMKASNEVDLQAKYAYTEQIAFNVGIAHYFSNNSDYDIAYYQAGLSYKF